MKFLAFLTFFSFYLIFSTIPTIAQFDFFKPRSDFEKKVDKIVFEKNIDAGIDFLNKIIEKREKLFEAYQIRAELFSRKENFDKAILDLDNAIAIKSTDANLYKKRAFYKNFFKKDLLEALSDLELAQKYGYDFEEIAFEKAKIKENLKDLTGAVSEYNQIISINPLSINAHIELNRIIFAQGEQETAIRQLNNFNELFLKSRGGKLPKNFEEKAQGGRKTEINGVELPVNSYSVVNYSALNQKQFKEQQKALQTAKDYAELFVLLGIMHTKRLEFEKAVQHLDTAIKVDYNQYNAYGLKGKIHIATKEYEKAILDLNEALKMASLPMLYFDRGIAYFLLGKEKEAQKDFDIFLKRCPECKPILEKKIGEIKKQQTK